MRRKRRPLAALALFAMVALISACGASAPAGTGSASSTGAAGHAASGGSGGMGANSTASRREQGVKFSACMRKHGVPGFPDPDASGRLTIDAVANGSSLNPSSPAFTQALSACQDLEPAGFTGGGRSPAQQAAALKFARCVRENGVTDFPDPVNGQPLVDTNRIPSSATSSGMSVLHAAMRKCSNLAAAAGVQR